MGETVYPVVFGDDVLDAMLKTDGVGSNEIERRLRDVVSFYRALRDGEASIRRDHDTMFENLTSTQTRCTELLDEARANRRIGRSPPRELHVLGHVAHELRRVAAKWGEPQAPARLKMPDGTGGRLWEVFRDAFRSVVDRANEEGNVTWAEVLVEEVLEALAESECSPKALRQELIQVAASAICWAQAIDARADAGPRNA